jgi:hypothetical protein
MGVFKAPRKWRPSRRDVAWRARKLMVPAEEVRELIETEDGDGGEPRASGVAQDRIAASYSQAKHSHSRADRPRSPVWDGPFSLGPRASAE